MNNKIDLSQLSGNLYISGSEAKWKLLNRVRLFATLTIAHQALLSMEFSRQKYQSGELISEAAYEKYIKSIEEWKWNP